MCHRHCHSVIMMTRIINNNGNERKEIVCDSKIIKIVNNFRKNIYN